ncbi:NACHT domain-containing protein [Synechococcus moorigangaii CMS01]|nr:NACHT domain-containing protein [Synechococcus moorigangaii CMS01]
MPKQSYGKIPQGRSQTLLFALLDFANDALTADDPLLERLRGVIKIHWQSPRRLVVQTKLRHLQALTHLTANPLTLPQVKTALKHLADFLGILEDHRTARRGSDNWHFSLNFWGDRWERATNLRQFQQAWEQRRSGSPQQKPTENKHLRLDWAVLCREALQTQLTSNPLTAGDGFLFELGELYVPLGVVPQAATEEDVVYQPQDFFAKYLSQDGGRLAIIGEPGAGKTTFLQQLALGLAAADRLPVWIPLGALGGRSLENYLLTVWLPQVFKQFTVAPTVVTEFVALVQAKRVWFLLDGLDEMGENPSQMSAQLAQALQGWLGNGTVVLTCRRSIWEMGKNALADCTIYCCQRFDEQPAANQVQTFIQNWFRQQPALGDRLNAELQRPVNRRLRELVRYPLYLTLLCRTWQLTRGKLPGTKATLYRQFMAALYDWKQDTLPTTGQQRHRLTQILAQLAYENLQGQPPKFRFQAGALQSFFEAHDPDLLTLALQLGWLQQVGHAEATGEKVYAFYPPTFQDYFAATAIAAWEVFLDRALNYPIFSAQWQETILLWLGRAEIAARDKETFLTALLRWQDDCGGFYTAQALCFVGKALAEFPEFSQAQWVIDQLVQWRFAPHTQAAKLPFVLVEEAGIALARSDRQLTVPALERFLQTSHNPFERWLAAHSLGKNYDFGNPLAIATLTQLLNDTTDPQFQLQLCRSLGTIDPNHRLVLATLLGRLTPDQKVTIRHKAALRLGKLQPNHPQAIQTLVDLAATSPQARASLRELCPTHPLVQTDTVSPTFAPARRRTAKRISERSPRQKSPQERQLAQQSLLKKLRHTTQVDQRARLLARLSTYDPSHPELTPQLLETLTQSQRKNTLKLIIETLSRSLEISELPDVLPQVRQIYTNAIPSSLQHHYCYKLLWHCSKVLAYPDFQRAWSLPENIADHN